MEDFTNNGKPMIHDDMTADEIVYRRSFVWATDQIKEVGLDAYLAALIPQLMESIHLFPAGHGIFELLSRWDPKTQKLRDAPPEPWQDGDSGSEPWR